MTGRLALALLAGLVMLLGACGDDLESRNAAIAEARGEAGGERQLTIQTGPRRSDTSGDIDDAVVEEVDGDEDILADDDVIYDADPESLIDSAEGFSTAPIDSGRGIDPSPMAEDAAAGDE